MYFFKIFICLLFTNILFSQDIDINFKNLEISELIRISSKILDKNILLNEEIKGKVNFISNKKINKKELKTILLTILESKGYSLVQEGNFHKIIKAKKKKFKKKNFLKSNKNENILLIKKVKHIEASTVLKIIKEIIKKHNTTLDKDTFSSFNESNNSIILISSKKRSLFFENLINKLDVETIQVYIKAKIVEVNDDLVTNIGIKYGILAGSTKNANLLTLSSSLNGSSAFAFSPSEIGLNIPNISSGLALGASLNLLKQNYALDIVSEPSLLCLNNIESSIYVGETISILTGTTTNSSGTSNSYVREEVGLKLSVRPRIIENKVILHLKAIIEGVKSTRTISGNADTSKKEIQTTALVNNGESIILGGLVEEKNEKSRDSIPLLGDIPILGEVFKSTSSQKSLKNLIIIITPYIVPRNKDLSYIRKQLAILNILENRYLDESLKKFKSLKEIDKRSSKKKDYSLIHKKHLEIIYGNKY